MKKHIIIIISLFLIVQNFNATEIFNNQIKIPKHYKTENTFSGDLSDTNSFHLIFAKNKNTKNYEVFSYLFDGENIQILESLTNKESYSVVSFHQKNEILSLLLSYKIKKTTFLKRVDYNLTTKVKSEITTIPHDDFLTSIRQKDKSILIYKTDDFLRILTFSGNEASMNKELLFKDNSDVEIFFKNNSVTSIKTDEFVSNGATSTLRLYYENNTLFFTKDSDEPLNINIVGISLNNKKANTTQLLKLDLKDSLLMPKFLTFKNVGEEKFKKATSFFSNNKLFQLALSKKVGFINISDANTGISLNSISIDKKLANSIKGNPNFIGIEKFLKNAGKNKNNITITANKTKTNKTVVRVDYVNINYSYNYNWWWHHQQFMWHQQQHQMFINNAVRNIPSGFGPRIIDDFVFENGFILKEKRFFELLIDTKGELLNEDLPETVYNNIDKKIFIDRLEEVSNYSLESSCFLEDSFRFIAFDKNLKVFIIQTNTIK
jgi:hypothetical protein